MNKPTDEQPSNAEEPALLPPSRRARYSILAVGLIAYFLLAVMCLVVAVVVALRFGWIP